MRIASATTRVAFTMIGPTQFGSTCRTMIRVFDAPIVRAASTNSRSRSDNVAPRTTRAIEPQSRSDRSSVMPSGAARSSVAERAEIDGADRHRHREERERGERDPEVGEPHEQLVEPAAVEAGERPDHHADDGRQDRDAERDLQRDLPAVQHARQRVAAQLVGAEPVRRRRARRRLAGGAARSGSARTARRTKQASTMNTRNPSADHRRLVARGTAAAPRRH